MLPAFGKNLLFRLQSLLRNLLSFGLLLVELVQVVVHEQLTVLQVSIDCGLLVACGMRKARKLTSFLLFGVGGVGKTPLNRFNVTVEILEFFGGSSQAQVQVFCRFQR